MTRRIYRGLLIASVFVIGLVAPSMFAQDQKPATPPSVAPSGNFYEFVNATRKFTDEQISWSY